MNNMATSLRSIRPRSDPQDSKVQLHLGKVHLRLGKVHSHGAASPWLGATAPERSISGTCFRPNCRVCFPKIEGEAADIVDGGGCFQLGATSAVRRGKPGGVQAQELLATVDFMLETMLSATGLDGKRYIV